MYRSHLMIDVGNNPDRPRPGRLWLRNIYHVHQRLSMAFPVEGQRDEDRHFLRPFDPARFGQTRFLFRIDNHIADNSPRAIILVQSEARPDWDYAFQNARMFLAAEPETREWNPTFAGGGAFRFRICVNLSKKSAQYRKKRDKCGPDGRELSQGKRVALTWEEDQRPEEVIVPWFANKALVKLDGECEPRQAFELLECNIVRLGWVTGRRHKGAPRDDNGQEEKPAAQMKFRSALLEGRLAVTDADAFRKTIGCGIGSGKAFGFGLLSVARVKD